MKSIHILNGDCLADQLLKVYPDDTFIVCRECLVEGDLHGSTFKEFMGNRAEFISKTYNVDKEKYFQKTSSEFEKIKHLHNDDQIYLWFENDLFCQTNLWFILSLLSDNKIIKNVFRIFPIVKDKKELWKGFGNSDSKLLKQSFEEKIKLSESDINFGKDIWSAYKKSDTKKLRRLSNSDYNRNSFRYLKEVCEANTVKSSTESEPGKPELTVIDILKNMTSDFSDLFSEFCNRAGIYGYGDTQVRKIYEKIMNDIKKKKG